MKYCLKANNNKTWKTENKQKSLFWRCQCVELSQYLRLFSIADLNQTNSIEIEYISCKILVSMKNLCFSWKILSIKTFQQALLSLSWTFSDSPV